MQAVVINKTGGADVLQHVQDFPKPSREAGQVHLQKSLECTAAAAAATAAAQLLHIVSLTSSASCTLQTSRMASIVPVPQVSTASYLVPTAATAGVDLLLLCVLLDAGACQATQLQCEPS
jgi:hypothetical protein